jgi:endonuclease-8
MPEGDVVARTAHRLDAALTGRELTGCDLRWPSLATVDLTGRTVLEVLARGKHLLLRVDGGPDRATPLTLHSHLRMEGSWHVHRSGQRWTARSADGVRAVLATDAWTAVGHRLGMLDLVPTAAEGTLVGHLGPDLLGPDWDLDRALRLLRRDGARTIGEALLDQRNLAGIGTMFMAEALFVRGVSPWTPLGQVDGTDAGPDGALADLVVTARRMLEQNLERAVQTTTGDTRPGQETYVHGRARRPCRRCGTPVRVDPIGVAPQDRVAFHCASCQPPPTGWVPAPLPPAPMRLRREVRQPRRGESRR